MSAPMEYVVRCGRGLFLGLDCRRAGSAERARRFSSKNEAKKAADALRVRGAIFALPWTVEEAQAPQGGAA